MTTKTRRFVLLFVMMAAMAVQASEASAQNVYVAFAESGGFSPNGAWGMATNQDRFSAIGDALRACQTKSLTCDSELDCLLRPGMFAAFASDFKVPGNRGISCNQPTAALAQSAAMAGCGAGCRPVWSGSANGGAVANNLEDVQQWVRTTFRSVVGRNCDEPTILNYARQILAQDDPEEAKRFFAEHVWPTLR